VLAELGPRPEGHSSGAGGGSIRSPWLRARSFFSVRTRRMNEIGTHPPLEYGHTTVST